MTAATYNRQPTNRAAASTRGGAAAGSSRAKPEMPEKTRRTFAFISDPANAHLFTKESARKAFSRVKI
ncbi:hypothetical protein Acav_1637 [Paracidovorax avenae ATCC 19860]|uniref:Uncharacterized protein n=1 Tax=Paracidovorax avenae (strain ATCC 19860 / DSM 7227 / CCUG 15838 / JCM 20985 / LMG 2117 / NCPPB 1011) TaxID=643561 RepID=F0Q4Q3_PARA1|nr:hypothetical protein [Paracidovorax avenae]ADX45557.1 hypothetical protein Acav_1637 [Paracidovorax avenae ATCC 19860]